VLHPNNMIKTGNYQLVEMKLLRKNLSIGHLSTVYHTNFILMESAEFQEDLGIPLKWRMFGTGPEMIKAFGNEEIEVGYLGLPPAIIGMDQGILIKCAAGGHVEGTIMVAKTKYKNFSQSNDDSKRVLLQFRGKKIGVTSPGSIHDVIIRSLLEEFSLKNEIELINYGQAEYIALDLKKDFIDAGVGTPSLAVFSSTLFDSHVIMPARVLCPNNPSYGLFFHEKILREEPHVVEIVLKHHKVAATMIRKDPVRASKRISKVFKIINEKYVQDVFKISPNYCIALNEEYVTSTMMFVKILHELNYIKKPLQVTDIFNFEFVEKIHPEKNHYHV